MKNVLKMHGHKFKFIMKVVQVLKNKKSFEKGGRRFLKLKKMGGEEETILKHKVKAGEKSSLTNKKLTLAKISQRRIPIPWIDIEQEQKIKFLRKPRFKCIKYSQKIG